MTGRMSRCKKQDFYVLIGLVATRPGRSHIGPFTKETRKRTPPSVLVEQTSPGVLLLTLNDPALPNVLTHQLTARWTQVVEEISQDTTVRAVVLTGTGDAFCVGADLSGSRRKTGARPHPTASVRAYCPSTALGSHP